MCTVVAWLQRTQCFTPWSPLDHLFLVEANKSFILFSYVIKKSDANSEKKKQKEKKQSCSKN